jgi:transposase
LVSSEAVVGLPGYEVTGIEESDGMVRVSARFLGEPSCPHCGSVDLRIKDRRVRKLRHESWGTRRCELQLEARKWRCRGCQKSFWQRFPGVLPGKRATEPFRRSVYFRHWDGIPRSRLGEREKIGGATVERWFIDHLGRDASKRSNAACPRVLGIDEHFFSRRHGFATTFCDLTRHKVYDVVLGRSAASLEGYLSRLKGKDKVQVVCMDLSVTYRSLVKKHFPNAKIVADRFHVIRLVNHQFLTCWRQIDPVGSKNRGLLSLMRRHPCNLRPEQAERLDAYLQSHPALLQIYGFKQQLCTLLLKKHQTKRQCRPLVARFLRAVRQLQDSKLPPLIQLGETLESWAQEIVTMWRFTKNNGITEGFHNKMETLSRRAYGFRNFENYRLRVRVMCS